MTPADEGADSSPKAADHPTQTGSPICVPSEVSEAINELPEPKRQKVVEWLEHTEYAGDPFLVLVHTLWDKDPAYADKLINDVLAEREHDREQDSADRALAREDAKAHTRYTRSQNWFITVMTWVVAVGSLTGAGCGAVFAPHVPVYFWLSLAGLGVGGPVAARILAANTSAKVKLGG